MAGLPAALLAHPLETVPNYASRQARRGQRVIAHRARQAGVLGDVSEALYLRDPDGNGVELYRDRPAEEWPRTAEGGLAMYTRRLDLENLLREVTREDPSMDEPG